MQEWERINMVFAETGKNCDIIEEIVHDEDGVWQLQVSQGTQFTVIFDTHEMLNFSAEVAVPSEADLLGVYTALLQFNRLQTETGGVSMALDDAGTVEQLFRLPSSSAEPRVLQHVIENLTEKVLLWRVFLSEETADAADSTAPSVHPGMMV